jgi:Na+:H+ antiporter, NhaA family
MVSSTGQIIGICRFLWKEERTCHKKVFLPFIETEAMKLSALFTNFFESEKAGGFVLIFCTLFSLLISNTPAGEAYLQLWHWHAGSHSLEYWINDGLMTIFFLLIGLELEREIYAGELSQIRNAALPLVGALGGMVVPAAIFLVFNYGTSTQPGAGIPMATDIAFAVGILSLLGRRVPPALKVFLTAFAVIDDLGAILVIAIFYAGTLSVLHLSVAMGIFVLLLALNRLKVRNLVPYLLGGAVMWYFMLHSGVHATITGVLLAFAIPFGDGSRTSTSYILQRHLHKPVAFFILPLFALANTSVVFEPGWHSSLLSTNSAGIFTGLVLGKPIGIVLFALAGMGLGLCTLPSGLRWRHIAGAGCLGGIGFTMSIFITLLAFREPGLIASSKITVLFSSFVAGITGYTWLRLSLPRAKAA